MSVYRCCLLFLLVCLACVPGAMAQPELPTGQEARSLTFSPDGKLLALAVGGPSDLGFTARRLEVWDVAIGQRRHAIEIEPQEFTFFAFSPDGTKLLSCGVRPRQLEKNLTNLVAWDTQTGQQIYELKVGAQEIVLFPVFSQDGTLVAASAFGRKDEAPPSRLKVWDAKTGELKHDVADLGGEPSQVSFTPDGKYLIVTVSDRLDQQNTGSRLLFLERDSLRLSHAVPVEVTEPTGFIVAPDSQSIAHFYVTQNGGQANTGMPIEFHLSLIALQGDHDPLPVQMETKEVSLSAFTFSPDGNHLLAVASFPKQQHPAQIWKWDTKTGQRLSALPFGQYSMVQAMFAAITPDAQTLAIARGTTVELRRTSDGELVRTLDVLR